MVDSAYSILNLGPDEFMAALDELGLEGEERRFLTDQYFAQNRALPMTERPEGMTVRNILPIATPEGVTGAEALMSGDFEFTTPELLRGLYEGPAEAFNVADAVRRGVPVTEEQVLESGMTAAEMATGLGPGLKAVDTAQRRQADEFFRETGRPTFSPETAANARFYYPSHQELVEGNRSRDPDFMDYASRAADAEKMLGQGVSPEAVLDMTGIMPVPLRSTTGEDAGFRLVMPTDDSGIAGLRTKSPYRITTIEDPSLPKNLHGEFAPSEAPGAGPNDYEIRINPRLDQEMKESTYRHERTHGDLMEGEIGWNEIGMSEGQAFDLQQDALDTLDELISSTTDVTEKADYAKLRDELKDLTSFELYSRNPGEMLARLSQGDATMAKRLSTLQVLNPYLNPKGLFRRGAEALDSALLSERRPYIRALKKRYDLNLNADVYAGVPMDMDKALLGDIGYYPENPAYVAAPRSWNGLGDPWEGTDEIPPSFPYSGDDIPFARGGIVKGSYLDNDPYD
jgi:hypothetical protein